MPLPIEEIAPGVLRVMGHIGSADPNSSGTIVISSASIVAYRSVDYDPWRSSRLDFVKKDFIQIIVTSNLRALFKMGENIIWVPYNKKDEETIHNILTKAMSHNQEIIAGQSKIVQAILGLGKELIANQKRSPSALRREIISNLP